MLNIKIENFEGPLDLLLHLIEMKKMDIKNIVISNIIDDYLEIINEYDDDKFKIKVEFLQMATELLEIKAKSVLDKDKQDDKKENLEYKLIEYKLIKDISKQFSENENEFYRSYTKNKGEVYDNVIINHDYSILTYENLKKCIENIFKANKEKYIMKINIEEEYTVDEAINNIMDMQSKVKIDFSTLLKGKFTRARIVAHFMAILELYKSNIIDIVLLDDNFYIIKE